MERVTNTLLKLSRTNRMSTKQLCSCVINLGSRTDRVCAVSLKKVGVSRHGLCKVTGVKSSPFADFQRLCTVCTATVSQCGSVNLNHTHIDLKGFSTSSRLMKGLQPKEIKKRMDDITDLFAEARELLGDARESVGSTYFSDDMSDAQEAVSTTLQSYEGLLADLTEDQKNDVIRVIGLRMEELKAQEQAIKDLLD